MNKNLKRVLATVIFSLLLFAGMYFYHVKFGNPDVVSQPTAHEFTLVIDHMGDSIEDVECTLTSTNQYIVYDIADAGYMEYREDGFYWTIDGETLDWDRDGKYWAIYSNGEYSMVGLNDIKSEGVESIWIKAE